MKDERNTFKSFSVLKAFTSSFRLPPSSLLFKRDMGCAEESGVVAAFGAHDLRAACRDGESALVNLFADVWVEQLPARRDPSADDDHLRVEDVDETRQPSAQVTTHPAKNFERQLVSFNPALIDRLRRQLFSGV